MTGWPTSEERYAAAATGDDELRAAVRTVVYEPIEPLLLAVARWVTRWLV